MLLSSAFRLILVVLFFPILPSWAQSRVVWNRSYGGEKVDLAYGVIRCSDGGFVVCGETWSFGAIAGDVYVFKISDQGDLIWEKRYSRGPNHMEWGRSIVESGDGGYMIAGHSRNLSGLGNGDLYLMKLDGEGNLLWDRIYGGDQWDEPYSIVMSGENEFLIVGYTEPFVGGRSSMYMVKLNGEGELIWDRTLGDFVAYDVLISEDGNYIVGGNLGSKLCLVAFDRNGKALWNFTDITRVGVSFGDLAPKGDEGFLLAGLSHYSDMPKIYLLEIDSSGEFVSRREIQNDQAIIFKNVERVKDGFVVFGGTFDMWSSSSQYMVRALKIDFNGDVVWEENLPLKPEIHGMTSAADGRYLLVGSIYPGSRENRDVFAMLFTDEEEIPEIMAGLVITVCVGYGLAVKLSKILPGNQCPSSLVRRQRIAHKRRDNGVLDVFLTSRSSFHEGNWDGDKQDEHDILRDV